MDSCSLPPVLVAQHAAAMEVDGFWVFLLFAVINIGLIAWCFRLVKLKEEIIIQ